MVRALQTLPALFLTTSLGIAQVSEQDLTRSYSSQVDGAFLLQPGVRLKGIFDKQGRACLLTLHGKISGDQAFRLFDFLVPARSRGVKKLDVLGCAGSCERVTTYEHVKFSTGAVWGQTSEPAAIITFSRADCEAVVADAAKVRFYIKR